jgi:hypothetical protein
MQITRYFSLHILRNIEINDYHLGRFYREYDSFNDYWL